MPCGENTRSMKLLLSFGAMYFDWLFRNGAPNRSTVNTSHTMIMAHDEITRKMFTMVLRSKTKLIKKQIKTKHTSMANSSLHRLENARWPNRKCIDCKHPIEKDNHVDGQIISAPPQPSSATQTCKRTKRPH